MNNHEHASRQAELENQTAKRLKFDLATALLPEKGSKSALLTTIYKRPGLHICSSLEIFKGPTFTADTIFCRNGLLLGAETTCNVTLVLSASALQTMQSLFKLHILE